VARFCAQHFRYVIAFEPFRILVLMCFLVGKASVAYSRAFVLGCQGNGNAREFCCVLWQKFYFNLLRHKDVESDNMKGMCCSVLLLQL